MVRTPVFLGDRILAAGHQASVAAIEELSQRLVLLSLESASFRAAGFTPGDVASWRATPQEFRHYTPAVQSKGGEIIEFLLVRHGQGPGDALLAALRPGDALPVTKFASKRSFAWAEGQDPLVVVGDGTVLGLARSFRDRAARTGRPVTALIEVAPGDEAAAAQYMPGGTVVTSAAQPGAALEEPLRQLAAGATGATLYLAGHGKTIQRQRDALRQEFGVDRKAIKTQPFWVEGKTGL